MTDKLQLAWRLQNIIEDATKAKNALFHLGLAEARYHIEQLDAEMRQVERTINVD